MSSVVHSLLFDDGGTGVECWLLGKGDGWTGNTGWASVVQSFDIEKFGVKS